LADKAGMTQTRISHIEHGTVVARRTERLCIAKALDVAPESIVWPKVKLTDRQRLREAARERRQQARIEALSS
jgi:transcriptional regulator with XRE-family HTH domain